MRGRKNTGKIRRQIKTQQKKHNPIRINNTRQNDNSNFIFNAAGHDFEDLTPIQQFAFFLALSSPLIAAANHTTIHKYEHTNYIDENGLMQNSNPLILNTHGHNSTQPTYNVSVSHHVLFSNQQTKATSTMTSYKNIPINVLSNTSMKKCTDKNEGGNAGKICIIKDNKYLMKVVNTGNLNDNIITTNVLLSEYNFKLLQNIGLKVPTTRLFYEKDGFYRDRNNRVIPAEFYHASQFINDFHTFESFSNQIKANIRNGEYKAIYNSNLSNQEIIRAELVKKIYEKGIAQLAVASTFIDDVITNQSNWGLANNDLYIIDVDNAPQSLDDYYSLATSMPLFFKIKGIPLSLNTLEEMKKIYKNMLDEPIPILHQDVDISADVYQLLIKSYLKSCEDTSVAIKLQYPNHSNEEPNNIINRELEKNLQDNLSPHRNQRRLNF